MKEPENDFLVYNGIPAPDGEDSVDHVCRMLSENSPVLCPRLHALVVILARDTIAGAEQYRCNASSLVAMANTRSRMGHRICRFYIQTVRSAGRRWVFRSEEELMGPLFQPLADCVDEYRPCGPSGFLTDFRPRPDSWDSPETKADPERHCELGNAEYQYISHLSNA